MMIWFVFGAFTLFAAPPTQIFFQNLNAGKKQTVLIYGTSLSHGGAWAGAAKEWFDSAYPGLVTFVNSSGPGQNSAWGVANLKTRVLDHHPNLVFVEFSFNDAHEKFKMPVETGAANLDQIVKGLRAQDTNTVIVLQIMNVGWDAPNGKKSFSNRLQLEEYNSNYRLYAKENDLPLLDHFPHWLQLKKSHPEQFQTFLPDGTHPNKEGSLAITWPTVKEWLEKTQIAANDLNKVNVKPVQPESPLK
ncbi:MAG: hypothetical protein JWQ71_4266 [Pedosphaera sp.]|nr:hypothetical protein [Pedosphaera sp.]